jgi:hypothetical protein
VLFDADPVNESNEEEIADNCSWLKIINMPVRIMAITMKFSSFFTESPVILVIPTPYSVI